VIRICKTFSPEADQRKELSRAALLSLPKMIIKKEPVESVRLHLLSQIKANPKAEEGGLDLRLTRWVMLVGNAGRPSR
jgi:hypothetical protein